MPAAEEARNPTVEEEKPATPDLSTVRKSLYSCAVLGIGSLDYIVALFLLKYYTDYTGLDAKWAGLALLIGKSFDALSDPIMGYISDRTRSRWGRRRPWFFAGSAPLAVSFIGMFSADPGWSQTQLFAWLVATNVLFWVGNTMVEVPHAACGSELTSTHGQRISLMGWREGFKIVGLLLGGLVMFNLLEHTVDAATAEAAVRGLVGEALTEVARIARGEAHSTITAWLGVYVVAATGIAFFGTRERSGPHTPPRDTLFGDFSDALRSPAFRLYAVAATIGQIADGLTATLALYAIRDWWGLTDPHSKYLMIGYMAAAALSIPVWMRIALHFEKGQMLAAGTLVATVALIGMLFVPQIGPWWAYVTLYLAGAGLGGRAVIAMAIMPDIIDDDEVRTHTRKDGAYFGMYSLLRKLSRALAMGLAGLGLGLFGYAGDSIHQSPEALRGILIMFCIVPIAFTVVTAALFLLFPITRARHEKMLAELRRRRDISGTTPPVPGSPENGASRRSRPG
jgi:Na+/melibiose symporter-like transporter